MCGGKYRLRLTARNAAGVSHPSEVLAAVASGGGKRNQRFNFLESHYSEVLLDKLKRIFINITIPWEK